MWIKYRLQVELPQKWIFFSLQEQISVTKAYSRPQEKETLHADQVCMLAFHTTTEKYTESKLRKGIFHLRAMPFAKAAGLEFEIKSDFPQLPPFPVTLLIFLKAFGHNWTSIVELATE